MCGHTALWARKMWCLQSINKKKEDITVQSAAISLDTLKGQTHPKISPHHPENVATGGFAVSKATQTVIFMTPKNKLLYSGCVCVCVASFHILRNILFYFLYFSFTS